MRGTAVALATLAATATAGVVTIPLQRRTSPAPGLVKRGSASVGLADLLRDVFYVGEVEIGTPPVSFTLQLDTGSIDLVIITDPCTAGCIPSNVVYRPGASSTAVTSTNPFRVIYGDGSGMNGTIVQDVVSFGGLAIPTQKFGAGKMTGGNGLEGDFLNLYSGLLGLGFVNTVANDPGVGAVPLVQALYKSGKLDQPLFAFAYATQMSANNVVTSGGYLTLGGVNSTYYSGSINYVPLSTPVATPNWIIPCEGISLNGAALGLKTTSALIDSGTSAITVPKSIATTFYAAIPGAQISARGTSWTYPCSTVVQASLRFGGQDYPIPPQNFNLRTETDGVCRGAINSGNGVAETDPWIIGDSFMKGVYAVFRFEPLSVGFAPLLDPQQQLESNPIPVTNGTQINGLPASLVSVAYSTASTAAAGTATTGAGASSTGSAGAPAASQQKAAGVHLVAGFALASVMGALSFLI